MSRREQAPTGADGLAGEPGAGRGTVREIIAEESAEADVVFLGLNVSEPGQAVEAAERLVQSLEGLRTVFFVKNASPFLGKLVSPEKGGRS